MILDHRRPPHHVDVAQDLGSADLEDLSESLRQIQHTDQIADDVGRCDGLGPGVHPPRGDHGRQVVDELPGDLPRDTAVADDDRRPQHGDRHAAKGQQLLDVAAGAQVR